MHPYNDIHSSWKFENNILGKSYSYLPETFSLLVYFFRHHHPKCIYIIMFFYVAILLSSTCTYIVCKKLCVCVDILLGVLLYYYVIYCVFPLLPTQGINMLRIELLSKHTSQSAQSKILCHIAHLHLLLSEYTEGK